MSRSEKNLLLYLVLLIGMLVFFVCIIFFRYDRFALTLISVLGSIFYIFWGIIHHVLEGRLKKEVVVEYVFLSVVAFLLFYLVLYS
ncbi:hypothetical protein A2415_00575 [candidate division WWE3 bacterium RIFOXYC1_FULL_39_7]|uniref:Uncharacterized protein n=1 Tax=candidate division WWE3 bacterium RIFOXYC1_FULL_39_7 TaxID=1802643 RepID=A0A1F4WL48_UNCKA|nr:MAG: hypothetical protein A2415_00575 [candidate division WWE3 bacterium RIFOXYC1_FULL_39_7]